MPKLVSNPFCLLTEQTEESTSKIVDIRRTHQKSDLDEWHGVFEEHIALLPVLANKKMWTQLYVS